MSPSDRVWLVAIFVAGAAAMILGATVLFRSGWPKWLYSENSVVGALVALVLVAGIVSVGMVIRGHAVLTAVLVGVAAGILVAVGRYVLAEWS